MGRLKERRSTHRVDAPARAGPVDRIRAAPRLKVGAALTITGELCG